MRLIKQPAWHENSRGAMVATHFGRLRNQSLIGFNQQENKCGTGNIGISVLVKSWLSGGGETYNHHFAKLP